MRRFDNRTIEEFSSLVVILAFLAIVALLILSSICLTLVYDVRTLIKKTSSSNELFTLQQTVQQINNSTISTIIESSSNEILINRSTETYNINCGNSDPCYLNILEEKYDRITNQNYSSCTRIVRPQGTPCSTSCISNGKCTGFIGSSEKGIQSPHIREPFCNATTPENCNGYCNSYLDCVMPNFLRRKIYNFGGDNTNEAYSWCGFSDKQCRFYVPIYNLETFYELYPYDITFDFNEYYVNYAPLLDIYPPPNYNQPLFNYGSEICEYIIYDKFDSNNQNTSLDKTIYDNIKNNKGCFDYYMKINDIRPNLRPNRITSGIMEAECIYQYSCSRPNYINSLYQYSFVPPQKRFSFSLSLQEDCHYILYELFTSIPLSLLGSMTKTSNTNVSNIDNITNSLTINDITKILDIGYPLAASLSKRTVNNGISFDEIKRFLFDQCFVNVRNPTAPFILKPRSINTVLTESIKNDILNSFMINPGFANGNAISFPSKYKEVYESANFTLIGSLSWLILQYKQSSQQNYTNKK